MNSGQLRAVVVLQFGRRGGLNQFHNAIAGIHGKFLWRFGKTRPGLYFGHAVRQNQANAILLRVERARVQTILHGPTERKYSKCENRDSHQHFVKRKSDLTSDR
jgi:hypothetical protein